MDEELAAALGVLVDIHTQDNEFAGFQIIMGAYPSSQAPWVSNEAYVKAWSVVRERIGRRVDPSPSPSQTPSQHKG